VLPLPTVTEPGRAILPAAFEVMLTGVAAGAFCERVTVQVVVGAAGAAIAVGVQVRPVTMIDSFNETEMVEPNPFAVNATFCVVAGSTPELMVKLVEREPAGTVTFAGTLSDGELLVRENVRALVAGPARVSTQLALELLAIV
jgi:hypothetical protein